MIRLKDKPLNIHIKTQSPTDTQHNLESKRVVVYIDRSTTMPAHMNCVVRLVLQH